MKFIVRDTDYAMRSLMFMAEKARKQKKDIVTAEEMVNALNLPEKFMRRVFQKLAKERILSSYKGKAGGFSFLKAPGKIRLVDIIEIFQGKVDITNCLLRRRPCPNIKKCLLRKRLKGINLLVNRELGKITIASLL